MNATTAPIITGEPSHLEYLDTDASKALAADLAGDDPELYSEALIATRAIPASNLNRAIQNWAADNNFTVHRIAYLNAGVHITISSSRSRNMIATATPDFARIVAMFPFPAGSFTVVDADTGEELDY